MAQVSFQLNSQAAPVVIAAGEEQTPVVIIDDFAKDTSDVIRYAVDSADFTSDVASYYPGARARPPSGYLQEIVRVLGPLLGRVYSVPDDRKLDVNASYFLVATPPEE